jgi:protein-tyrosine phosphatase
VVTPHQLGNFGENRGETIREACGQLQELLDRQGIGLRVLPGADVRIEPDLIGKVRVGEVVTLADRGRYVLLELPHELYLPLDRLLSDFRSAGLVAVLSHPERNWGILRQPQVAERLVEGGCLLQVTAGSLVGAFGPQVKAFAESLVLQGYVHFVATDAHGPKSRRPLMRRAYQRVAEMDGEETAVALCCGNPDCVVNDRIVPGRRRAKRGKGRWFRWSKAG